MVPDTKTRILQTALKLYNQHGVYNLHGEQITARRIAAELNMSDGNLRYHFPTREDIIRGLYDQLVNRLSTAYAAFSTQRVDWQHWLEATEEIFETLYEYRFFHRDFVSIMQHQHELRIHFGFLQKQRREVFQRMLKQLQLEGQLRPEPLRGQYEQLFDQLQIFSDSWVGNAEITYEGDPLRLCRHYAILMLSMFLPYLSIIGLEKWQKAAGPLKPTEPKEKS